MITNVHVSHNTNVCQQLSLVVPVVPLPIPVSLVVQSLGRFWEIWVKITNLIDPELPTHSDKYTKKNVTQSPEIPDGICYSGWIPARICGGV